MNIAFFIPHITRKPGFENNVSAHVQLPCEIAGRLLNQGHRVEILTDSLEEGYTMPVCLPPGIKVIPMVGETFVTSADRAPIMKAVSFLFLFVQMAFHIKRKVSSERYDVVHFFGTERILILSRLVSLLGGRSPLVMTFNQYIRGTFYARIRRIPWFWGQLSAVIVSMDHMKTLMPSGIEVHVLSHGIIKDLGDALEAPARERPIRRVLFWRTPDYLNGGDICIEVFRKLAPQYPDVDFDLAIRAESEVADLEAYDREVENGHVFRFPYQMGVTLESLLSEAVCVFQPFREYTYHPQFVILESLMLGIPVVASDLPGVEEIVQEEDGNGFVFPLEDLQIAEEGIRNVLEGAVMEPESIRKKTSEQWSWDGYETRLLKVYESVA